MSTVDEIRQKYEVIAAHLNERQQRLWAGTEAMVLGHGGVSLVARATGMSRNRVNTGLVEVCSGEVLPPSEEEKDLPERVRRAGAGRPLLVEQNEALMGDLDALVEPATRGEPDAPLRWTSKSTRKLADELRSQGHKVSARSVERLLKAGGYSLQGTSKTLEGATHPDRDAQFEHINERTKDYQEREQPVISVDTKKKELIGEFANKGREWHPQGQPVEVNVHDFADKELGKAVPYGVYDVLSNEGWVNVGVDHDTPEFAVESIRRWWKQMGQVRYPQATEVLIMADCGGSNSYRARLWKVELQKLSDEIGLTIEVCHFPPGTSKWNKIEHRLFCHITQNWRGRPLVSREVVVNLIANTTTREGLRVGAELDTNTYEKGIKVSDKELAALNLQKDTFHGEWNYKFVSRKRCESL